MVLKGVEWLLLWVVAFEWQLAPVVMSPLVSVWVFLLVVLVFLWVVLVFLYWSL